VMAASGVLAGDAMTPEAAMTKLIHLTAQPLTLEDKRKRFLTSLAGER
ncbi:asparaginase, partial [Halomonas sp. BBD48]|nr:asparaginase [Halomonas sp. BBD48]